jgi:hypothetical protein
MEETTKLGTIPDNAIILLIYSADILGAADEIDSMGPFRKANDYHPYAEPFPGHWTQTEGDEGYQYGYLGNESGNARFFPAGYADSEGVAAPQHNEEVGEGRHRKWVGELTLDEWIVVAGMLVIDIDDRYLPVEFDDSLGAITEYGHIPALAIDNTEGWSPMTVIDSTIYMSIGIPVDDDTPEAA